MTERIPPASNQTASSPTVIEAVRTRSLQQISVLLKGMFTQLNTYVFDLSKTAPDSEQQNYMDVIAAARVSRSAVETRMLDELATAFMNLQKKSVKVETAEVFDLDSLSLVDPEEMDISVTVDVMAGKARLDYAAPLGLLRQRFSHVLQQVELADSKLPLDPGAVGHAFKSALVAMDLGVSEKIIMLRIFQFFVMSELGKVLEIANQIFIEAGVLPDLKLGFSSAQATTKKADKSAKETKKEETGAGTEEIFSFLQNIMGQFADAAPAGGAGMPSMGAPAEGVIPGMQYHAGQYVGGGGIGALPASVVGGSVASIPLAPLNIAPTAVVQTVATPELVNLLSQIQQLQPKAPLVEDASAPSVEDVRSNIRDNLRSDAETVEAIKRSDEDVINLVSMLFDFILDDDDLPTAMKALIGRLQIPLLKVAILDKSFFNAETHSARRLLNLLAKAGIGWSSKDPSGDVVYTKIEDVVFRILNEFIDDLELFDELLEEFTTFYEQQQKREDVVDKRTREAEEGKARADLARAMVQQTLNRRLTGRQLPLVAIRILQESWRNVLYLNCLREGTESESWKQAVKVVDALIWSVLPQEGEAWQNRLKDVAPKLVNSLKKGLAAVNYDPLATETLLRELAQVHLELMSGAETRRVAVVDSQSAEKQPVEGQVSAAEVASSKAEEVASVVLPEADVVPVITDALPGDDENVVAVSRLNVGSWIEFMEEQRQERHKLVARIRSVDKLIFANRRGIKVGEMTGMRLAIDLSIGKARVVEEGAVIDRALESVIGNLRNLSTKAAQ